MTIKYLQKCNEVCQQKIGWLLVVLMGLMSFGTIILVMLKF
jgi:hypothetical protein